MESDEPGTLADNESETLIERMPRHRARRRSPLRSERPDQAAGGATEPGKVGGTGERDRSGRDRDGSKADAGTRGPTPDPFGPARPIDAEAAAALMEGMRAVAEVADLALTATALILREIEAKLTRPHGEDGSPSGR